MKGRRQKDIISERRERRREGKVVWKKAEGTLDRFNVSNYRLTMERKLSDVSNYRITMERKLS